MNIQQILVYLFCKTVDFEQWLYYLFNGGTPRRYIPDPQEEILPHRRIGTVIWNVVENHGISGALFVSILCITLVIVFWIKRGSPFENIRRLKGILKVGESMFWYAGLPAVAIIFVIGIINQVIFFINGCFK